MAKFETLEGRRYLAISLTLMDSVLDQPIAPLTDQMEINLDDTGTQLSIVATSDRPVESIQFKDETATTTKTTTESLVPYAIAGDNRGDLNAWPTQTGDHTLTVTSYPADGAGGDPIESTTVVFTVIPETHDDNIIYVKSTDNLTNAIAHQQDGTTFILADGIYNVNQTLRIHSDDVTLRSADGQQAIIRLNSATIDIQGSNDTISGVDFKTINAWTILCDKWQTDTLISDCVFDGTGFDGVQLQNAKNVTISECVFKTTAHYGVYAGGLPSDRINSGIKILNSTFYGSVQHCIRIHKTDGLLIDGCVVHNEWDKYGSYHGSAITLKEGHNYVVTDTTIYGSFGVGPLPSSPSDQWLDGITIKNVREYGQYFAVEGNTKNLLVDGMSIYATKTGNAFNVEVNGKATPSGIVRNVKWNYPSGVFCRYMVKSISWQNIQRCD